MRHCCQHSLASVARTVSNQLRPPPSLERLSLPLLARVLVSQIGVCKWLISLSFVVLVVFVVLVEMAACFASWASIYARRASTLNRYARPSLNALSSPVWMSRYTMHRWTWSAWQRPSIVSILGSVCNRSGVVLSFDTGFNGCILPSFLLSNGLHPYNPSAQYSSIIEASCDETGSPQPPTLASTCERGQPGFVTVVEWFDTLPQSLPLPAQAS